MALGFVLFNVVLLRKLEFTSRRDFLLSRRLKEENIDINLEMEAFQVSGRQKGGRKSGRKAGSTHVAAIWMLPHPTNDDH